MLLDMAINCFLRKQPSKYNFAMCLCKAFYIAEYISLLTIFINTYIFKEIICEIFILIKLRLIPERFGDIDIFSILLKRTQHC